MYCYKCKTCGEKWEQNTILYGDICHNGSAHEVRRDWKSERAYMKRVPGGGREHSS